MRKDKSGDDFEYDPKNEDHRIAMEAAREVVTTQTRGQKIVKDSAITALEQMMKLTSHLETAQGKAEALKHHALYMGVGEEFMRVVSPLADKMVADMQDFYKKRGKSIPDAEAEILTSLFLAKVFMQIGKQVEQLDNE